MLYTCLCLCVSLRVCVYVCIIYKEMKYYKNYKSEKTAELFATIQQYHKITIKL